MTCCAPTIIPFYNVPTTDIGYSAAMREKYGSHPRVEVLYQAGDEFYLSTNQSRIALTGNPVDLISVDHGGVAAGIIRII